MKGEASSSPAVTGLTIILTQNESINASESKHVQEVPGSRAHPRKSE